MSSYLSFRKNGVNVISFSRNSEIYEVLRYQAPIGEWAPVDSKALCEGLEELYDSKQRCLNYKKTQEKPWSTSRPQKIFTKHFLRFKISKNKSKGLNGASLTSTF